ncbi:hypothetical protein LTR16_003790, partial [Cryomyces antarcticus]
KLRAAAPDARDTRERRRRARLQDKHQVRVASGQKMPEILSVSPSESGRLSPQSDDSSQTVVPSIEEVIEITTDDLPTRPASRSQPLRDGDDVADRALSMLQDLRGGAPDPNGVTRDDSIRVKRRRESSDAERRARRERRRNVPSGAIAEEPPSPARKRESQASPPPPTTVVSPPSPVASENGATSPPLATPPG